MSTMTRARRRTTSIVAAACAFVGLAVSGCTEQRDLDRSENKVDFRIAPVNGIKNSFLVGLRTETPAEKVPEVTRSLTRKYGGEVQHIYTSAVRGYAVVIDEQRARKIAHDPRVRDVGQDVSGSTATQTNPPTHLDRIDQASRPLVRRYNGDLDLAGRRPDLYIIDGGLNTAHTAFASRALIGEDFTQPERKHNGQLVGRGEDCNGHGTHVAALASSTKYGVARGANIVAVKISNCAGKASASETIAAVDWVHRHARPSRSVVNMSLAFTVVNSPAESSVGMLQSAIQNSINAGIPYVVAAGNDGASACNRIPARIIGAITVAAVDSNDARASFSNFGACVDIFAPGRDVVSASNTTSTGAVTMSGTSQASPQVAGAVAIFQAVTTGQQSPTVLSNMITSRATQGIMTNSGSNSPNRLLRVTTS